MDQNASDARQRVIGQIIECARETASAECRSHLDSFIWQYYRNISLEDLKKRDVDDLAGAAVGHLDYALTRRPGKPKARIFNPEAEKDGWSSPHTIVEIINDDMPFLVDSLGMVINRHDRYIHLTVHPVIKVRRDAGGRLVDVLPNGETSDDAVTESLIHVEIDRIPEKSAFRVILGDLLSSLEDVRLSCQDWSAMRSKCLEISRELVTNPPPLSAEIVDESRALLEWMEVDHFTFLGYREYELVKGEDFDTLKVVPDTGLGILRKTSIAGSGSKVIGRAIRRQARSRDLLLITKANSRSTVHRPTYLDYVSIKSFDSAGRVAGEKRFLGLLTSVAYSRSPRSIPVLRHKVEQVMEESGLVPDSHGGKALRHILDTFPRDELFQASVEELSRISSSSSEAAILRDVEKTHDDFSAQAFSKAASTPCSPSRCGPWRVTTWRCPRNMAGRPGTSPCTATGVRPMSATSTQSRRSCAATTGDHTGARCTSVRRRTSPRPTRAGATSSRPGSRCCPVPPGRPAGASKSTNTWSSKS